jgi:hypothetical protein
MPVDEEPDVVGRNVFSFASVSTFGGTTTARALGVGDLTRCAGFVVLDITSAKNG